MQLEILLLRPSWLAHLSLERPDLTPSLDGGHLFLGKINRHSGKGFDVPLVVLLQENPCRDRPSKDPSLHDAGTDSQH